MFIMKKNVLTFISFIIGVTILLVACYEELDTERSKENVFMTYEEEVTAAREFYESMRDSKTRGVDADFKTESGMIANMEPLWGKQFAYRRKNKKIRTVEAVMDGSKRVVFMLPEVREKYKQTKDSRYKQSMTRLVVTTDLGTGEQQAFTMTIMPDLDYLEKTNFKPFYNTYVQKDKDFSGVILFHELDGYFANGWRYSDGRITHSIEGTTFSKEEIDRYKAQTRATKEECGLVDYYQLVEECKLWCYKNEFIEVCEEDYCYTYWEYVTSKWECRTVEYNPESGQYNPPPKVKYIMPEKLKVLFENNMIGNDIKLLSNVMDTLLKQCVYTQLYNYINENDFKLKGVKYDSNMFGDAGVSSLGYLKFRSKEFIGEKDVKHEFFHIFQCAVASNLTYHTNVENITATEFERHLFDDICTYVEAGGDIERTGAHAWACQDNSDKELLSYTEWIGQITESGQIYPNEIPLTEYRAFLNLYWNKDRNYGKVKGYNCNVNAYSPNALYQIFGLANSECK